MDPCDLAKTMKRLTSPVRQRWEADLRSARQQDDDDAEAAVLGFRSDLGAYRHAWEFLSQITDFEDPSYRRRAIFAAVIERNLHLARPAREEYTSGLSLAGVALAPERLKVDVGVGGGAQPGGRLTLPAFEGQVGGAGSPVLETFEEVVERVNDMFAAAGIDVSKSVQDGFVRAMWGSLMEDPAFEAMTRENSAAQLAQSSAFGQAITGTLLEVSEGNRAMLETLLNDPSNLAVVTEGFAQLAESAWKVQE